MKTLQYDIFRKLGRYRDRRVFFACNRTKHSRHEHHFYYHSYRDSISDILGRNVSVVMTHYVLDGLGIESCRSRWPSGLRRGSVAHCLLGLLVRILPGTSIFVFCVCCTLRTKGKKCQENQENEIYTEKEQREDKKVKKSLWG